MSSADDEYHKWLASDPDNRCFDIVVPRAGSLQDASRFNSDERSFQAKYPGDAGHQMRQLVKEMLRRMNEGFAVSDQPATDETATAPPTDAPIAAADADDTTVAPPTAE